MKRVPLKALQKLLRAGDYIGIEPEHLNKVTSIELDGFCYQTTYVSHLRIFWTGHQLYEGRQIDSWKSYYWLPAELLDNSKIVEIKKQRSKKETEKPLKELKRPVIPAVPTRLEDLDMPDWLTGYLKEHEIYTVAALLTMGRCVLEKIGLSKEAITLIDYCLSHFNLSLKN